MPDIKQIGIGLRDSPAKDDGLKILFVDKLIDEARPLYNTYLCLNTDFCVRTGLP